MAESIAVMYAGDIVEIGTSEEIFFDSRHPYTWALLSAIPLPNPHVEHRKKLLIYDPGVHDYAQNPPDFVEIDPGYFVLANARELETYRRMLDAPAH